MKLHLSRIGSIAGALLLLGLPQCSSVEASGEVSIEGIPGPGANASYGSGGDAALNVEGGSDSPDEEPPPPEIELEETFTSPVATGKFVWTANPATDRVALVNAADLTVQSVEVGQGPTYIAAVPSPDGSAVNRAIVINVEGDDASLLTERDSVVSEQRIPLHPQANSWAISASGRWAIAWTDVDAIEVSDPTEGFQALTVIRVPDVDAGPDAEGEAYRLTAGYRPHRVFISEDESYAFVVCEPGITVIELGDVPAVEQDLSLAPPASGDAEARDVSITPDGRFALVRREGDARVEILEVETGEATVIPLSGAVTDLDLMADGSRAIAVVRQVARDVVPPGSGGGAGGAGGMEASAGPPSATAGTAGQGVEAAAGSEVVLPSAAGQPGTAGMTGSAGAAGVAEGAGTTGMAGAPSEGGVAMGGWATGGLATGGVSAGSPATGGLATGGTSNGGLAGAVSTGGQGATPEPSPDDVSEVFILRLPDVFDDPTAFDRVRLEDQLVGSVSASIEGTRALLFTNAVPSDQLTILNTADGDEYLQSRVVALKSPVEAVFPTPDAQHAIALLRPDPNVSTKPGAFSVVPIARDLAPNIYATEARPRSVALANTRGVVTVRDDATQEYGAFVVRLPELQADEISLKSPPLATGLVPAAQRAFVAQEHPLGRITFIHLTADKDDPDHVRTLTGFELGTRVVGDAEDGS